MSADPACGETRSEMRGRERKWLFDSANQFSIDYTAQKRGSDVSRKKNKYRPHVEMYVDDGISE